MTVYELLDLLIAELVQLRAENRRLKFELAAARSQRDSFSSASPLVVDTGRPELWWGGPINYSDADESDYSDADESDPVPCSVDDLPVAHDAEA
jgi:hypothetical protein